MTIYVVRQFNPRCFRLPLSASDNVESGSALQCAALLPPRLYLGARSNVV